MNFNNLKGSILQLFVVVMIGMTLACAKKDDMAKERVIWAVISGNELRLSSGYKAEKLEDDSIAIIRIDSGTRSGTIDCLCDAKKHCKKPKIVTQALVKCDPSICDFCTPVVFVSPELLQKNQTVIEQIQ